MLLADYGSDSGSDNEDEATINVPKTTSQPTSRPATLVPSSSNTTNGISNVKAKKRTGPVRITLDLPKASKDLEEDESNGNAGTEEPERETKKPKLGAAGFGKGAGSSSLLGMLPAPKRKLPTSTSTKSTLAVNKSMATLKIPEPTSVDANEDDEDDKPGTSKSGLLLPSSISRAKAAQKGKAMAKADDSMDLFGLSSAPAPSSIASSSTPKPASISITSAPEVKEYVPPPPTVSDPYPGYYQLPSGSWAAYDPEYYHSFFKSPANGEDEEVDDGRVGRHWDELDQMKRDGMIDVNVGAGLEAARRESERQERLVAPKSAQDQYEYKPIGQVKGLASQRHQLTSLLNDVYSNREELEDRIAQNKKNMRAAGQKYGF